MMKPTHKLRSLVTKYPNRKSKERTLGRFYASELGQIIKGYKTPDEFFKQRTIDEAGAEMISCGEAFEAQLECILREMGVVFDYNPKKEIKIGEMTLVVKPDFVFKDWVLETKFMFSKSIEKYKFQLEAEFQAFQKPVWLGIFSLPFKITMIPYKQSERRWNNIKEHLKKFHDEVKKI